jgi:hypothetical protein
MMFLGALIAMHGRADPTRGPRDGAPRASSLHAGVRPAVYLRDWFMRDMIIASAPTPRLFTSVGCWA